MTMMKREKVTSAGSEMEANKSSYINGIDLVLHPWAPMLCRVAAGEILDGLRSRS